MATAKKKLRTVIVSKMAMTVMITMVNYEDEKIKPSETVSIMKC